jgi:hypothetical protein
MIFQKKLFLNGSALMLWDKSSFFATKGGSFTNIAHKAESFLCDWRETPWLRVNFAYRLLQRRACRLRNVQTEMQAGT